MKSMTGFGRGTHHTQEWNASIEASSVNRKQAELIVNLPRHLQALEPEIRLATLPLFSRGRVQLAISLEKPEGTSSGIHIDAALARSLESAFSEISSLLGRPVMPLAADFIRHPGIISIGDSAGIDHHEAWSALAPALLIAMEQLVSMRTAEGAHLRDDFTSRLDTLASLASDISHIAPIRPDRQRDALLKRLADLGLDLDPSDERVLREIALFIDRSDISEEITRLDSHFSKFRSYLSSPEPAGRSLDFLCQELFREFNTIGAKAADATIAQTVVSAKTELEKLREQVQNIE